MTSANYLSAEEFERDLDQNIHLENNLLFPWTLEMARAGGVQASRV